ncbi:nitrile hydratase subunit beta [Blastococcus sp. MG754426]|uniref:SH3-like domain-containing protein n=1 Tax=unclassified Blastococcus TaxID=2619396 RepID=UPI00210312B4|nr:MULTISPECIES: SH3-like domain-containing protein [unclassified Blastococcus]MCF6506438.1 nitrile hydratase subunit beta [Blastococcus sp. MG754426]MCF6511277.1 nitrile hydratase subunit beta [Blastococcus sp. MG754427]
MREAFNPGDRVRTTTFDPPGHTRLPRYARGAVGEIVERAGNHPRAEDRARGLPGEPQPVYHVRFRASDLFGSGDHTVTVELWQDYLEPLTNHDGNAAP